MNQEKININEIMRNTRKYWYVDGLSEIAGGILIIFVALTYFISSLIPNLAIRSLMLGFGQPFVIIIGSVYINKIVKRVKENVTYPRTGYLSFRRQKSKKVSRIILIVLLAIVVSGIVSFISSRIDQQIIPFVVSIFVSILTIYLGYQNNVPRFYLISLLTIGWGMLISYWSPEGVLPFVFMFGGVGVLWLISGAWTFFQYLRETKPMEKLNER